VQKLYGQGILFEVVNQKLNQQLENYIKENDLDLIGNLMNSEAQELYDFNPSKPDSYSFLFELGWFPNIDIKGADQESVYASYELVLTDEDVMAELEKVRARLPKSEETDGPVEKDDMLEITAEEKDKEEPFTCTFKVRMDDIGIPGLTEELIGKTSGYLFDFNVYELEKDAKENIVRKYILGLPDNSELNPGPLFTGTISKVLKNKPADLNEDFLKKAFGENTENLEDAKTKLKQWMEAEYNGLIRQLLFRDIRNFLLENNKVQLADEFITRSIKEMNKNAREEGDAESDQEIEINEAQKESYREAFVWMKLRDRLVERFELDVSESDLDNYFANQIMSYFGGNNYPYHLIEDTITRMKSNRKSVNEAMHNILDTKVFGTISEVIQIDLKPIALKELLDMSEFKSETEV
jgi:trigger factor